MAALVATTPLMEQYNRIKAQIKDEVLFFRLGDFYEMFGTDAIEVSRLLNLTLTHRADQAMCGIPYHAAKIYIARLLRLGKKIAIAEQIGEVSPGGSLTERKIVEIITPGTAVEDEYLDRASNNFLAALCITKGAVGFAYIDVTTSDFFATSWSIKTFKESFAKELGRASPRELLLPLSLKDNDIIQNVLTEYPSISLSYYPDWNFNNSTQYKRLLLQFNTVNLDSFSLKQESPEIGPAGFLLDYLDKTTGNELSHIKGIKVYSESDFVIIDDSSRRNLEIVQNLRDGTSAFTLLECINYTETAMGNRAIRSWLLSPLMDAKQISARADHVQMFFENDVLLKKVRDLLKPMLDIERLAGRIAMKRAHAKDLVALMTSLESWINVQEEIAPYNFALISTENARIIVDLIHNSICDDPSTVLTEGRLIRQGYSSELDHFRDIKDNFSKILDDYVQEEREKTGILNLKVLHNNVSGYFLEVTKGKLADVPEHFVRTRTLVNADRFTTARLEKLEKELNSAESNIVETEKNLFLQVREKISEYVPYLLECARDIAYTDVTSSLAEAAHINRWVRPQIDNSLDFEVENGRHPVVERHIPSGEFVPNNLALQGKDEMQEDSAQETFTAPSFVLLTGPNMAGKSTYLRQNALIALLAQIGSYVPSQKCRVGIVDKIFCRVGASDNLAHGESTFLVEMTETARILRSATTKSLVIMDEVGRGTSTEDGLSIAWAVTEYLLNTIKARTLFATHYHELTRLVNSSLKLMCMDVKESNGNVIFLRKIKDGASENSYGIHVARLAGVPQSVTERAEEILKRLQKVSDEHPLIPAITGNEKTSCEIQNNINIKNTAQDSSQTFFESSPKTYDAPGLFSDEEIVLDEILSTNTDDITPLNALQAITRWKNALLGK